MEEVQTVGQSIDGLYHVYQSQNIRPALSPSPSPSPSSPPPPSEIMEPSYGMILSLIYSSLDPCTCS